MSVIRLSPSSAPAATTTSAASMIRPYSKLDDKVMGAPRLINSCNRCRSRKQRCDQRLPNCTACEKAGVECVSYDKVAGREVPRSYVTHLEERVAHLEIVLSRHGIEEFDSPVAMSPPPEGLSTTSSSYSSPPKGYSFTWKSSSDSDARISPSLPSPMMKYIINASTTATTPVIKETLSSPIIFGNSPYPSFTDALQLSQHYFDQKQANIPILDYHEFMTKLHALHTQKQLQPSVLDRFVTLMVFAISANCATTPQTVGNDVYLSSAVAYADYLMSHQHHISKMDFLLVVLLFAQLSSLHVNFYELWQLVGTAIRCAVDLGLHLEPSLSSILIETQRRLFWSAYTLDRWICSISLRPVSIPDGAITLSVYHPINLNLTLILAFSSSCAIRHQNLHKWPTSLPTARIAPRPIRDTQQAVL